MPRWTVWPALAVLLGVLPAGVPLPARQPFAGAAAAARSRAEAPTQHPRLIVLGIDGLDPEILLETIARFPERMPHFRRLIEQGDGVRTLHTSCPPQSPVAWSNFITGRNPGGHGVYDFLHRDLVTRAPIPSSTVSEEPRHVSLWGDWQFPLGGETESNRSGPAFWEVLAEHGVPADIWRMPINFPVQPSRGVSFPDMMTPAIDSAYGECTLYTTDPTLRAERGYDKAITVDERVEGRIDSYLIGPGNPFREGDPHERAPVTFYLDRRAGAVAVDVAGAAVVLAPGQWSDFLEVHFDLLPGMLGYLPGGSLSGVVRFYLRSIEPELEVYASPVNFNPKDPATPVSDPVDASADLADAIGLYYTQGMAEDVNALKRRLLTVEEFMSQADLVYRERGRMLDYALDRYLANDEGGLLFFYYSTVDLCCHMMWRHADATHPHHEPAVAARSSVDWSGRPGSTWKDAIHDLYLKMDESLGRLVERVGPDTPLIVMSDHGFAPYRREFSLNTWLLERGYLVLKEGRTKELPKEHQDYRKVTLMLDVDWSKTRAYGIGFNGLYLNLVGREQDDPRTPENEAGIVQPGAEAEALLAELERELEAVTDPDVPGARPVLRCDRAAAVYSGERVAEAPDILVGYDSGYGNSDPASLGQIPHHVLEDNTGGTFNGSHLMAPEVVNGLLLSNRPVLAGEHGLEDLTVEILARYGIEPLPAMNGHRVLQ